MRFRCSIFRTLFITLIDSLKPRTHRVVCLWFNSIIENSTFTVIIKLLHHWETPVQMSSRMIMLLFLLFCSFSVLFRSLFSLEAAVSVFASTSSTSMSLSNSFKTVPQTSIFGISSPNGSSDSIPV